MLYHYVYYITILNYSKEQLNIYIRTKLEIFNTDKTQITSYTVFAIYKVMKFR